MLTWQTLHDADQLPPPRFVAHALADLGAAQLEVSRVYVEEHRALTASGVPPKFCRELLDEPGLPPVEAMASVRKWDGSTAPCVLVGDYGTAKSHALAWWALERHRRGELTHWESVPDWGSLSLNELAERQKSLSLKAGLVLDDIGAGRLSKPHAETLEAVLLSRHARELPTGAALNVDGPDDLKKVFGGRTLDRIHREGGVVKIISSRKSLRRPPPEDIDGNGRSRTHLRHLWILDVVGCEMVSRGDDEGGYTETPVYGDKLAARLARPGWLDEAERVRVHLGVRVVDVVDVANNLAREAIDDPMMLLAESVLGTWRARAEQQAAARKASQSDAVKPRGAPGPADYSTAITSDAKAPAWTQGPVTTRDPHGAARIKDLGWKVRKSIDGFIVQHTTGKVTRTKATGCESEADAWECARRLWAAQDPQESRDTASLQVRMRQAGARSMPDASDAGRRRAESPEGPAS